MMAPSPAKTEMWDDGGTTSRKHELQQHRPPPLRQYRHQQQHHHHQPPPPQDDDRRSPEPARSRKQQREDLGDEQPSSPGGGGGAGAGRSPPSTTASGGGVGSTASSSLSFGRGAVVGGLGSFGACFGNTSPTTATETGGGGAAGGVYGNGNGDPVSPSATVGFRFGGGSSVNNSSRSDAEAASSSGGAFRDAHVPGGNGVGAAGTVGGVGEKASSPNDASRSTTSSSSSYEGEEVDFANAACGSATMMDCETVRCLFGKAYIFLNPSPLFRFVVYLYAERKLLVFYWAHFLSTMIIWVHFFLIKFEQQKEAVPVGAPYYYWKRLAPPLEFGSMHAILFQLALLPLTMCRYSIASLSDTAVNKFFPFNRMVRIHIYLGYCMIGIVIIATAFFFAFFGVLCAGGEQAFCDKFTSEIMITGYAILATLLVVIVTSYLRYHIPYEVFYIIHHIVFLMYAICIAHTLDVAQRSGESQRSQTFKWFSVSLLYYVCDRLAMKFHHTYRTKLLECSAVRGGGGQSADDCSRMLILKLKRPPLFFFRPGQYAFLKVNSIDSVHWHPFSIASGPNSPYLEFYIEVFAVNSWTDKLWNLLDESNAPANKVGGTITSSPRLVEFQVMGPCGTGLPTTKDYSHAVAIGTGTGIVPLLSALKQHVHSLIRLAPDVHFKDLEELQNHVQLVENAEVSGKRSMMRQIFNGCWCRKEPPYESLNIRSRTDSLRDSIQTSVMLRDEQAGSLSAKELRSNLKEFKAAAFQTTRSFYGIVLLGVMPVAGIGLIGSTISWNTVTSSAEIPSGWYEFLQAATVLFQALFAVIALFVWDADHFLAYTDAAAIVLAPFADWYWLIQYQRNGGLAPPDITTYCLFISYMTIRTWYMTIKPLTSKSWRNTDMAVGGGATSRLERLDVVWVTRSSSLVSKILPDVNAIWEELVESWGHEQATSVCRFCVYVTDQDERAIRLLKRELAGTTLYKNGMVRFGRPDIGKIIEDHSIEMICTRRSSYSLLAYVGSPELAREIHECKLFNDMKVAITGNKKHQMEFVSESYGGVKAKQSAAVPSQDLRQKNGNETEPELEIEGKDSEESDLSNRRTTSFTAH